MKFVFLENNRFANIHKIQYFISCVQHAQCQIEDILYIICFYLALWGSMFALLRIIIANQEDLESSVESSIRDAQIAISSNNEFRMLQQLIRICDNHLLAYPTIYEQDFERLKNNNLQQFTNERNVLIQIKGEKEILLYLKDFALTVLKLISAKTHEEFDELLNYVRINKHISIFQYCLITNLYNDN